MPCEIYFISENISIICLVDKLKIDKSISQNVLFHLGINKNPNYGKIKSLVGAASLHISFIRLPNDKFQRRTNLSFDKVRIKSDVGNGWTIETTVPLCASIIYVGDDIFEI